jgi:hypothetical protein
VVTVVHDDDSRLAITGTAVLDLVDVDGCSANKGHVGQSIFYRRQPVRWPSASRVAPSEA